MLRAAVIAGCVMLLAVVMYGALKFTPAQLTAQLRIEYTTNAAFLGRERALHLLDEVTAAPKKAPAAPPPSQDDISKAVSRANSGVPVQLSLNRYAQVFAAQMRLVQFRAGCMFAVFPGLMLFIFAAVADGAVRRAIKGHEFSAHDPEVVALSMLGVLAMVFVLVALVFWPVALPPMLLPSLFFPVTVMLNRAVANYRY